MVPKFPARWPPPSFDEATRVWTFVAPQYPDRYFDAHRARFAKMHIEDYRYARAKRWTCDMQAFERAVSPLGHRVQWLHFDATD